MGRAGGVVAPRERRFLMRGTAAEVQEECRGGWDRGHTRVAPCEVLVLSDPLASKRPLQSLRRLPMGVPQCIVSLLSGGRCRKAHVASQLGLGLPTEAAVVLRWPRPHCQHVHHRSAGQGAGTQPWGHTWCPLHLPPAPKPGLCDAAWDTGPIGQPGCWCLSSLGAEDILLMDGMRSHQTS